MARENNLLVCARKFRVISKTILADSILDVASAEGSHDVIKRYNKTRDEINIIDISCYIKNIEKK